MATPIKSTNVSGNASANGVSPAVSDLLARLGNQADGQNPQMAFSRWMEQHAVVSGSPAPKPASEPAKPPTSPANTNAKLTEQALARSRQQAMLAKKSLESKQMAEAAQSHGEAAASQAEDSQVHGQDKDVKRGREVDKKATTGTDKDDQDTVAFSTASGEGAAVVRELTPPSTIQPGDAAGMMAWLASLTHGDLPKGKGGGDGELPTSTGRLQGGDGRDAGTALVDDKGAAGATHGALALDNPLWQSMNANANLQADALIAQPGRLGDGRAEGDAMAGILAGGGLKGAGLPGGLGDVSGTGRHESATLSTPLDSPDFAQALADKVSMWVSSAKDDGSMTAELHLNPAEMGPINVKIALDGQTAQVDFAAAALETRKAIEASLTMLSSALSDVGLNMTGGDVSSQTSQQQFDQGFAQSQGGGGHAGGPGGRGDAEVDAGGMRQVAAPRPGARGGLDLYA